MSGSIFHILEAHSSYIYGLAIVVTIIALAISTRYSLRNLLNIHAIDDHMYAVGGKTMMNEACSCDTAGNDGDDEADPDGEEEAATDSVYDTQQVFSQCQDHLRHSTEYIPGEINRAYPPVSSETIEK